MTVELFPCNGPQRIFLPLPEKLSPLLGQVSSWRVIFTRETVPVFNQDNAAAADSDGYFPIVAAYLEANGCKPSLCEDATVFIDDCMSRCSVWLNEATVIALKTAPEDQVMDFKIKIASASINNAVYKGSVPITLDPTDKLNARSGVKGMICIVSGVICTQFEFWARIRNTAPAMPVDVRIQFDMDRLAGQAFGYAGTIAGGGDLPHI